MTLKVWSWRQAIAKAKLESSTKLVLYTLANYMNEHGGGCYPTIEQITEDSGLSRRSVITHLDNAVAAGFITRAKHGFAGREWANNDYKARYPEGMEAGNPPQHIEKIADKKGSAMVAPPPMKQKENGSAAIAPAFCEGSANNDKKVVQPLHTNSPDNSPLREEEETAAASASEKNNEKVNPQHLDGAVAIIKAFDEERVRVFGAQCARPFPHAKDHYNAGMLMVDGADVELCRRVFGRKFIEAKIKNRPPADHVGYLKGAVMDELALWKTKRPMERAPAAAATSHTQHPDVTLDVLGGDTPQNRQWLQVLDLLRRAHGDAIFNSWMKSLRIRHRNGATMSLTVSTKFVADYTGQRYDDTILQACKAVFADVKHISIGVG